jgi:hypothetical protein
VHQKLYITQSSTITVGVMKGKFMQKKCLNFIKNLNSLIALFLFIFPSIAISANGWIPIDDTTVHLSNGKSILTQRIDHHSHYVLIKDGNKIVWKRKFALDYGQLWEYAFFVPIKKDKYESDINKDGYPEIAICTWDGGHFVQREALIFTVKDNALKYYDRKKFNLEFSQYVYK